MAAYKISGLCQRTINHAIKTEEAPKDPIKKRLSVELRKLLFSMPIKPIPKNEPVKVQKCSLKSIKVSL